MSASAIGSLSSSWTATSIVAVARPMKSTITRSSSSGAPSSLGPQ